MSAADSHASDRLGPGGVVRSVVVALVCAVAVGAIALSVVGSWVNSIIDSPARTSDAVAAALNDEEVVSDLATAAADRAVSAAMEVLGFDDADSTSNPVVRRLRSTAQEWAADVAAARIAAPVIGSDIANSLATSAAGRLHRVIVETVVDGGGLGEISADEPFRVNLVPLVVDALAAAQTVGVLPSVELPDLAQIDGADAQRAAVSEALGVTLPRNFAEYTIAREGSVGGVLAVIEFVVSLAQRVGLYAPLIAVGATVSALALSRRRLRTLGALAAATAVMMVLLWGSTQAGIDRLDDAGLTLGAVRAIRIVAEELAAPLATAALWVGAASLAIAVVATAARGWGKRGVTHAT
ncbi:MAG: hypothetical protein R2710_10705 [Acidimicrobiales bacterium]